MYIQWPTSCVQTEWWCKKYSDLWNTQNLSYLNRRTSEIPLVSSSLVNIILRRFRFEPNLDIHIRYAHSSENYICQILWGRTGLQISTLLSCSPYHASRLKLYRSYVCDLEKGLPKFWNLCKSKNYAKKSIQIYAEDIKWMHLFGIRFGLMWAWLKKQAVWQFDR